MFGIFYQTKEMEQRKQWAQYGAETALYECPQETQTHINRLKEMHPHCKFRMQRLEEYASVDWRKREMERYNTGQYFWPENWPIETIITIEKHQPDHFVHVAKDGRRLAFTQSALKGFEDKQTPIGAGCYLTQFFSDHFTAQEIAALSALCGEVEVQVLHTSDEIENAYLNGPNSCMAYDAGDYSTDGIHPVRVYGDGSDLSLAVLERDDRITARALVWEEKKIYGRIYGDTERMENDLQDAGYTEGSFEGARLNKLETESGAIICTYLDDLRWVDVRHDCLVITSSGDYYADNTNGLLEGGIQCPHCGEYFNEDDMHYSESRGESMCEDCFNERHTYCDECHEYHDSDDVQYVESNHRRVCDNCLQGSGEYVECSDCGDWHHYDHGIITHDGTPICDSCADCYTYCEQCHEYHPNEDIAETEDGETMCKGCAEDAQQYALAV